jgi:2'-5' RNA ligase
VSGWPVWSNEPVAHSIELYFDDDTDAALRAVWVELADAGVPSQLRVTSASNRPHVTMAVAGRIDPAVDGALAQLRDRLPLPCTVGAPLIFGHPPKLTNGPESESESGRFVDLGVGRFTLAHLIVPSTALLELHQAVQAICALHMSSWRAPHTDAEQWTPHATLGRKLTAEQVAVALARVPGVTQERRASFVGLRRWDGDARVEYRLTSGTG